jgi:hypothetical protein
LVLKVNFDP